MDKDLMELLKGLMGDAGEEQVMVLDRSPENIHLPADRRPQEYDDLAKLGVHSRVEIRGMEELRRGLYSCGNGYGIQICRVEVAGRKVAGWCHAVAWFDMLLPEDISQEDEEFLTADNCWQVIDLPGWDEVKGTLDNHEKLMWLFERLSVLPDITLENVHDVAWAGSLPSWATD